jgi:hypothetical protein
MFWGELPTTYKLNHDYRSRFTVCNARHSNVPVLVCMTGETGFIVTFVCAGEGVRSTNNLISLSYEFCTFSNVH